MKKYTAIYLDDNFVIYRNEPSGNLYGKLPLGTIPDLDNLGTINRKDNGDYWEDAGFITQSGRKIRVKLEE